MVCLSSRQERKIQSEKRGSMTILLMNIGNFVMFAFNVVYVFMKVRINNCFLFDFIKFFTWCFLPLSLSALNPLIIVIRSTGFKRTMQASDSAFPDSHVPAANKNVQDHARNDGAVSRTDSIKLN